MKFNLTKHQEAIWLESRIHPNTTIFNIGTFVELNGVPNFDLLAEAISNVISENDAMRLQIIDDGVSCSQVFSEKKEFNLIDIEFEGTQNAQQEAINWMNEDFVIPINIHGEELYRIARVRFGDNRSYIYFKFHHICTDGWSFALMIERISLHYNALLSAQEYKSFGSYESYLIQAEKTESKEQNEAALDYWKNKFSDFERVALFPKKDVLKTNAASKRTTFEIERDTFSSLKIPGIDFDKGLFYYLLAAFYVTLSRSTGRKEFVIGVPLLNRFNQDERDALGFYVSLIPLRLSFDSSLSFAELVEGLRAEMRDNFHSRNVSIHEINKTLGVNLSNSTHLYDAVFSFETFKRDFAFGEAVVQHSGTFSSNYEQLPMVLHIQDFNVEDVANFEFDCNLNYLDQPEVDDFIARFDATIFHFIGNTNSTLSEAPVLFEAEKEILTGFSVAEKMELPENNLINAIFKTVEENTSRIAVRDQNKSITFEGLLSEAKKIAGQLTQNNVEVGESVAIMLPRSAEMITAILGVLIKGASYIPIDTALPTDRIQFMLENGQVKTVVCNAEISKLEVLKTFNTVNIEALRDLNFERQNVDPENSAYVIFTSGTTGRPKGVPISHTSILNLTESLWNEVHSKYGSESKMSLISSFSFDASVQHIFMCLIKGLELNIVPDDYRKDGRLLLHYFADNKIDISDGIPTHLSSIIARLDTIPSEFRVKHFVIGGEAFKPELARQFFNCFNEHSIQITNVYGPTECTCDATLYSFNEDTFDAYDDIPIGKSIQNTSAWILNEFGELSPPGTIGELCIGGVGLSDGYLNNPELTAEKFIYNSSLGERLYHTGDLAKWNSDGLLFFKGRRDSQVKMRGYRIELSEIEHRLSQIQNVDLASVLIDKRGDQERIVGFVQSYENLDQKKIKAFLTEYLPSYMIPHFVFCYEKLPLTSSGKIDRIALLKNADQNSNKEINTPSNETEARLSKIMAQVLEVKTIDVKESFFVQGGDSLGLIFLLAEIEKEFDVELLMSQFATINSVRDISDFLQSEVELIRESISFKNEMKAIEQLNSVRPSQIPSGRSVAFLTGATGFIGAYLLMELTQSFSKVYCLVRGKNQLESQRKLKSKLEQFELLEKINWDQITVFSGDLEKTNLGVTADDLERITNEVDAFYHCAAQVNFMKDYDSMKRVNINSTLDMLAVCKSGKASQFNYISTKGVFSGVDAECFENSSIEEQIHFEDKGYESTKWIADGLVAEARSYGIDCSIFRLGRITGDSQSGVARYDDFFHRFIEGCIRMKCFPSELNNFSTDLTPVDVTAKSIVALSNGSVNETYHIINQKRTSYLGITEAFSKKEDEFETIPYHQWYKRVEAINALNRNNPLFLITPILKDKGWFEKDNVVFNNKLTAAKMEEFSIEWPDGKELWGLYIEKSLARIKTQMGYENYSK